MNLIYYRRLTFNFELNNCDFNKITKSIKKLSKNNKFIIYSKYNKNNILSNNIYFYIFNNKYLKINFSHIYYDAFSIFFILDKIDLIYKNELEEFTFDSIDCKFNYIDFFKNNFNLLKNLKISNTIKSFTNKNKKTFKILKKEVTNLSNSELIKKILKSHHIDKFCLVINARKIFTEFDNLLGNIIFVSDDINIKDDLREKINHYSEKKFIDIANSKPNSFMVNSYIGFSNPSFVKKFHMEITSFGNFIYIYPYNNDDEFIIYDCYM